MRWRDLGLCHLYSIDLFFPPGMDDDDGTAGYTEAEYQMAYSAGKAVCHQCPVRTDCLQEALQEKERWGLRGGLIPIERLRIERKKRRQRLKDRRSAEAHRANEPAPTLGECP